MITAKQISFYYTKGAYLFKDLSFEVERAQILAVLGPNGAGKTTLLRCMMGFLALKSGEIHLEHTEADGGAAFWHTVSYVPQARRSAFDYSLLTMVMMGRTPHIGFGRLPSKHDRALAEETLCKLGLSALAEMPCTRLSGGQLQLGLIARALVKNPSILILDEPESNLDMKNQLVVLDVIARVRREQGITIILNTHFPAHALRIADKTLLLGSTGHLFGSTGNVLNEQNIAAFFGVHARIIDLAADNGLIHSVIPTAIVEKKRCIQEEKRCNQ